MAAAGFPIPAGTPRPSMADGSRRLLPLAGALGLAAVGVLMLWQQASIRVAEASLAHDWFGAVLSGSVGTSHDVVYFSRVHGALVGMRITSECTVALLTGPLCLLGAALLAFAHTGWHRLLAGLLAALAIVVAVNQLRLAIIAVAMQHWGMSGYEVSHKFVGTVVALAGFVAAALVMLKIATSTGPGSTRAGVGR